MARTTVSQALPMPRTMAVRAFFPECCRSTRPAAA